MTAEDKKPPPPLKYKDLINVSRKYRARLKGAPPGCVNAAGKARQ